MNKIIKNSIEKVLFFITGILAIIVGLLAVLILSIMSRIPLIIAGVSIGLILYYLGVL